MNWQVLLSDAAEWSLRPVGHDWSSDACFARGNPSAIDDDWPMAASDVAGLIYPAMLGRLRPKIPSLRFAQSLIQRTPLT